METLKSWLILCRPIRFVTIFAFVVASAASGLVVWLTEAGAQSALIVGLASFSVLWVTIFLWGVRTIRPGEELRGQDDQVVEAFRKLTFRWNWDPLFADTTVHRSWNQLPGNS